MDNTTLKDKLIEYLNKEIELCSKYAIQAYEHKDFMIVEYWNGKVLAYKDSIYAVERIYKDNSI